MLYVRSAQGLGSTVSIEQRSASVVQQSVYRWHQDMREGSGGIPFKSRLCSESLYSLRPSVRACCKDEGGRL
jgi:hypothetical protein